jgi:hypothetical protein
MSALDSCCTPCVTTPPVNIPGSAGLDAYTFPDGDIIIPAVGGTVAATILHIQLVVPGSTVVIGVSSLAAVFKVGSFIFGGPSFNLTNLGILGYAAPGTTIPSGSIFIHIGPPGNNAFTNTNGNATITLVGGSFNIPVVDASWAAVGQTIFVSDGTHFATFTVTAVIVGQITGTFLGLTGDSVPNFTISSGAIVTPAANPNTTYPVAVGNGGTNATTAAQARTNLGAAGSGPNTDITSLANLSTAITIAQGGTGQTTAVAGLTALITAAKAGTFVCNGVTQVTVVNTNVTAASVIIATLKTVGGTVGAVPAVKTITPGVGFNIAGTAADTSTYNYVILN